MVTDRSAAVYALRAPTTGSAAPDILLRFRIQYSRSALRLKLWRFGVLPRDVRYQVFVSSTYTDLVEERTEVMKALLELDCIPSGMELFPATNDESWSLIQKEISNADYYLLVIGGRYGSVTEEGISFTEKEYGFAIDQGVPVLAFVHANPDDIPAGKTEIDPVAREKLDDFREIIKSKHNIKEWSNAIELGSLVSRSIVRYSRDNPRTGWVRADRAATPDMLEEMAALKLKLAEFEGATYAAASSPPPGTEEFAQGDEKVLVRLQIDAFIKVDGVWPSSSRTYKSGANVTWNEVVGAVAPALATEANEAAMKVPLIKLIENKITELHDGDIRFHRYNNSVIDLVDFDTVKTQLIALGIIEAGTKKRVPSDKSVYWKLTPYGHHLLIKLRAIKSDVAGGD